MANLSLMEEREYVCSQFCVFEINHNVFMLACQSWPGFDDCVCRSSTPIKFSLGEATTFCGEGSLDIIFSDLVQLCTMQEPKARHFWEEI